MAGNSASWSNVSMCCKDTSILQQCSHNCSKGVEYEFFKHITGKLWRVDAMLLVNAILAGVIVGIGAYGHRYRHYGFTRYLLLGATTLFVPIISYVLSAIGSTGFSFNVTIHNELTAECIPNRFHPYIVIVSTCLVLVSAINASRIVATDNREDRSISPPFELLLQGIWIVYLFLTTSSSYSLYVWVIKPLRFTPFALIHAKMALKCYAFLKARKSFALGHNPCLIVGYMQQLALREEEENDQHGEEDGNVPPPPPLVVMGEDERQVEKQPEPHGYMFRMNLEAIQGSGLVTIERVWQLDNMLLPQMGQLKDTCLSFALFKLLRCRFARYKLTDVISKGTINFVRSVLLKDGEHERAFRMIADELSFLHDCYDSPLPISYSDNWLIIISMIISLLSIGYCLFSGMDIITVVYKAVEHTGYTANVNGTEGIFAKGKNGTKGLHAIDCTYYCREQLLTSLDKEKSFGSLYFDLVPVLLLLVFVVVAEARDIASHVCSSCTKVILTCRCVHRASMQLSPVVPKWVGFLLQCRCDRLLRHWSDKMKQSSLLVLHQLVLHGCLLRLRDPKRNNVKVPTAVKVCIINAIRSTVGSNEAGLSKGMTNLRQSQVGRSLLWACNKSKSTSDTILVWHIATAILEATHPHHQHDNPPRQTPQGGGPSSVSVSDMKIAATHLSRYCAYLVESCPELLPDDDTWSKYLYNKVKNDANRALSTSGGIGVSSLPPEAGYRRLIEMLGATQNHEVLKAVAEPGICCWVFL